MGRSIACLKPGGRFVAEMGGHGNVAAIHVALMAVLERHGFGDREDGVNYYPTPESYARGWSGMDSRWSRWQSFRARRSWRKVVWKAGCERFVAACWTDCRRTRARRW